MLVQIILNNGAVIRFGDADYHPFRSFPGQTKIAEMFQVEWLKTTMDQAKRIGHCFPYALMVSPAKLP